MHDTIDAGGDLFRLLIVAEIGGDKFVVSTKIGGLTDIADAERIDAFEQFAQARSGRRRQRR